LKSIQTNVRVAPEDKPLILDVASRLRSEPGFRDRLVALLQGNAGPAVSQRIEKLEEQVAWLKSGAIVVPRGTPPAPIAFPKKPVGR
jgi:hypothetical protein